MLSWQRISVTYLIVTGIAVLAAIAQEKQPAAAKPPMEAWWDDLEKSDPDASRALLKFAAQPKAAIPFFQAHLKPLTLDAEHLTDLLKLLASEDEAVWKPAFAELEYFDPRLAADLETLMDGVLVSPVRQRMVEVLSGRDAGSLAGKDVQLRKFGDGDYNFFADNGSWWAEPRIERLRSDMGWGNPKKKWTRALRAIVLLDHFGTPEAVALLKDLTTGHPDAEPTVLAKAALKGHSEQR